MFGWVMGVLLFVVVPVALYPLLSIYSVSRVRGLGFWWELKREIWLWWYEGW